MILVSFWYILHTFKDMQSVDPDLFLLKHWLCMLLFFVLILYSNASWCKVSWQNLCKWILLIRHLTHTWHAYKSDFCPRKPSTRIRSTTHREGTICICGCMCGCMRDYWSNGSHGIFLNLVTWLYDIVKIHDNAILHEWRWLDRRHLCIISLTWNFSK